MSCSFNIMTTIAWGLIESWKLSLNLCSFKWLKQSRSRVISLILLGLWQLQTELGAGLMDRRIFFLNVDKFSELRRPGCSLFHSEIVKGKKEFLKKLFYVENGNSVYIPCSVRWASHRKWMEKVLRVLIFKNFIKEIKFSVPTSETKRF